MMASGAFTRSYAILVVVSLVSAGAIAGVGYLPTVRLTSIQAVPSMLAGCAISWIAGCAGAIPLASALSAVRLDNTVTPILTATFIRFVAVLGLTLPAVLSGLFDRNVLVLWVGISYLLMLTIDTLYAVRMIERRGKT